VQERDVRQARRDTGRHQLELLTQLRAVDHWRRLVAARLDLAIAAVAALEEPAVPGLRDLLGLPAPGTAQPEAALLLRLRAAQRELDAHAVALRASTRTATADVVTRLDRARPPSATTALPARAHGGDAVAVAPVLPLRRRAGGASAAVRRDRGLTARPLPDDVA
jgi:hypothetical protein